MEGFLVLIIVASFGAIEVLFLINRRYTAKRILERWCGRRNYTLEKKKRIFGIMFFFSGAMSYRIEVVDKDQNVKTGKVTIGNYNFGLSTRKVRVSWD